MDQFLKKMDTRSEKGSEQPQEPMTSNRKRAKFDNMFEILKCPISHDIPVDPVTASDGHVYEREEILRHFSFSDVDNLLSPMTRKSMDTTLTDAHHTIECIERAIEIGEIDDITASKWRIRMQTHESNISSCRQKREALIAAAADCKDESALLRIALAHISGSFGFEKSIERCIEYLEKGAPNKMLVCQLFLSVFYFKQNRTAEALAMMCTSASQGCVGACLLLGIAYAETRPFFSKNFTGIPETLIKMTLKCDELAAHWFEKALDAHNKCKASSVCLKEGPSYAGREAHMREIANWLKAYKYNK